MIGHAISLEDASWSEPLSILSMANRATSQPTLGSASSLKVGYTLEITWFNRSLRGPKRSEPAVTADNGSTWPNQ
jgi:hypothetical protein